MGKFKLAFGLHNHQPVGNFEAVFEEAHQNAYAAFFQLFERFPEFSISLHQSGILWRWQQEHHPEYFELIGRLIDAGRLELMTGGFYEPILSAVPERDAEGQIDKLSRYLERHFDCSATGMWLAERIWEPHLPKLLARSGVTYLPIDDTHFIYAGFEHSQLTGPFITEHEGYRLVLLPIQKKLRYLIPFGTVDEVIAELRDQADRNPSGVAIYADDGEKFGVWPGTHKHCYTDGWLEDFFNIVAQNGDWLEIVPLSHASELQATGRAYLPTASYEEMLHWALPAPAFVLYEQFEKWLKDSGQWERYGRFVRGGHWRGFLAKYEEANLLQKTMLRVSDRLAEYERRTGGRDERVARARDRLYAAQCNCPYWHGVFGGLYLPHIRQAVYEAMIEADRILRDLLGETGLSMEVRDFDADGHDEVIVSDNKLTAIFRPGTGGMMLDLSLNERAFNLTDTLMRRREGYHSRLDRAAANQSTGDTKSIHDMVVVKEKGLEKLIVDDWYLKRCFLDHFFASEVTLEDFACGEFAEEGDFVITPYHHSLNQNGRVLEMQRQGRVRRGEASMSVRVVKRFAFEPGTEGLAVIYEIQNLEGGEIDVTFAVENNFSFQAGHAEDRYVLIDTRRPEESFLDSRGEHAEARSIAMVDDYRRLAVAVTADRPGTIWHCPIYTVSLSEGGFEKVYQGTSLIHAYGLRLSDQPTVINFRLNAGTPEEVVDAVSTQAAVTSG
jgi:hypothetical protein